MRLSGLLRVTFHCSQLMILTSHISCLAKGDRVRLPANESLTLGPFVLGSPLSLTVLR